MNITEVAVAVFLKPDGTFLLSSRPDGKPYSGFWEFPGGKIEAGETVRDALVRELTEELNVTITRATPWFTFMMRYTHAHVRLHCWRVTDWHGDMRGMERQAFQWQSLTMMTVAPTLPGCVPIFKALGLPLVSLFNIQESTLKLQHWRGFSAINALNGTPVLEVFSFSATTDIQKLDDQLAPQVSSISAEMRMTGVIINSREELERAAELKCDFAILALEDAATRWQIFASLVLATPLPCYAAGKITADDLATAIEHGAHGVALF